MKVEKRKTRERRYTRFRGNRKRTIVERFHADVFPNSSTENTSLQRELPSVPVAQNLDEEVASKASFYEKKKRLRIDEWRKLRETFTNIGTSSNSLERNLCDRCSAEDVPLLRCVDCCQWLLLCETCLVAQHNYPHLHIFEGWNCGTFSLVSTETPKWELSHACNTSYTKSIVIIDDKGRQHVRQICFCTCEPESATLLRYHLWPSSPKRPQLAFDIELLRWIHGLQMECQVSVKGFCEALHARLPKNLKGTVTNQIKDVYSILIKETMNEFRLFSFNQENLSHHLHSELDDGTTCAACFDVPTRIYSFDADFQLVRKHSAGKTWENPKHEGRYFLPQADVDKFMESYDDSSKKGIQVVLSYF